MEGFTFYRSYMDTARAIPDRDARLDFLESILSYMFDDDEAPACSSAFAQVAFCAVRPNLDKSKAKAERHRAKQSQPEEAEQIAPKRKQNESKKSKSNQNESKLNSDSILDSNRKTKSNTDTVTVTDTVTDNNISIGQISERTLSEEFAQLWEMYPRKEGKKAAYNAYKRARVKKGVTFDTIKQGIERYNEHLKEWDVSQQFIKKGSTYFMGESWDDKYTAQRPRDRNAFNAFEQHDYDFDELERELTQ